MNWEALTSIDQLNEINQESTESPVVIFKHSTTCSISSTALNRIERKWDENNHPSVKAYYLDLLSYRSISSEIASKYEIEHQSPQILVIIDGKCVYDNSHFGISYAEVLDKITPQSV